jgi:hypothetical protein
VLFVDSGCFSLGSQTRWRGEWRPAPTASDDALRFAAVLAEAGAQPFEAARAVSLSPSERRWHGCGAMRRRVRVRSPADMFSSCERRVRTSSNVPTRLSPIRWTRAYSTHRTEV